MHANFPSRQTNNNINFWVVVVREGGKKVDFLGRSVQCDPRTLSFYHVMLNCISTTLAVL